LCERGGKSDTYVVVRYLDREVLRGGRGVVKMWIMGRNRTAVLFL